MAEYNYDRPDQALAEAERRIAKCKREGGTILNLGYIGLATLPASLGELKQLQVLVLHVNRLREMPDFLGELRELHALYLDDNQIRHVPDFLCELKQLHWLRLSGNQLRELPASLGELQQLQELFLSRNHLRELPASLGELQQLTALYLGGNPDLGLPREVVAKYESPAEILAYYFRHHPPTRRKAGSSGSVRGPSESAPKLEVFLSHASADKPRVREIYRWLKENGFEPWLDAENIDPGDNWQAEITKAVKRSHVVLVCLSKHSVNKGGFVQKEIQIALDVADEKPEGTIYIIPVKLEECAIPDRLGHWHGLNLFEADGYDRLARSLRKRREQLAPPD